MPLTQINIGNAANDGTGDDLREAFIKVNQNFQILETIAEQVGDNLGAGAQVYKTTSDNTLFFRTLVNGTGIRLTTLENTIVIENTATEGRFTITTPQGSIICGDDININYNDGQGVEITADENTKTITFNAGLQRDPSPRLNASLDANNQNITGVGNFSASSILGTNVNATNLTPTNIGGVNYHDNLGRYIEGFDFGNFDGNANNILEWIVLSLGVDFGTFTSPNNIIVDLGNIV
jgi:hypothetical protein